MPKLSDMMPSKYLKHSDCEESDLVVTIADVKQETVGQGEEAEEKWVLYFKDVDKGLVLNKTNMVQIGELHGDDTDGWDGKKIALFATEVQYQGKMVMAIRVRKKAPKAAARKPAETAAAPAAAPANDTYDPELAGGPSADPDIPY